MKKDRVAAFTDAVLAIIMTILVLELEKPSAPTLSALWDFGTAFSPIRCHFSGWVLCG